jgi:hypothetical protein
MARLLPNVLSGMLGFLRPHAALQVYFDSKRSVAKTSCFWLLGDRDARQGQGT